VAETIDLESMRKRFPVLRERSYFATPCLGPFPEEMLADLDEYKRTLFLRNRAIEPWVMRMRELAQLVEDLLHAPRGTVALRDSVTACQAAIAATLQPSVHRDRILIAPEYDFPSSSYLWAAQAKRGFTIVEVKPEAGQSLAAALIQSISDLGERVAAVAMPWVSPRSGGLLSAAEVTRAARQVGAISVLDAYQGVGVVPLDVESIDADVVVGGVHKWLCGGGMGLSFMYVRPTFTAEPVYPGWVGHAELAGYEPTYRSAAGAVRFQQGTPAMEPIYTARAGIRFLLEVGIPALRARSLLLTSRLIAAADRAGIGVLTPRQDHERGGMVCLDVAEPARVVRELAAQGMDIDTRPGAGVRVGPFPCMSERECDDVVGAMSQITRTS